MQILDANMYSTEYSTFHIICFQFPLHQNQICKQSNGCMLTWNITQNQHTKISFLYLAPWKWCIAGHPFTHDASLELHFVVCSSLFFHNVYLSICVITMEEIMLADQCFHNCVYSQLVMDSYGTFKQTSLGLFYWQSMAWPVFNLWDG